jgi:hypothetical protein
MVEQKKGSALKQTLNLLVGFENFSYRGEAPFWLLSKQEIQAKPTTREKESCQIGGGGENPYIHLGDDE